MALRGEPMFASALMLDQIDVMRELYGDYQVSTSIAALDPSARTEVDELTAGGWCRVSVAAALKKELARRTGEGPLTLQRKVVTRATERTLHGIWRFFLSRLSDSWLLKYSPIMYSKAFDCGTLAVERLLAGRADIVVHDWPDMPEFDCVGIASAIEAILTVSRRARPRVSWSRRHGDVLFAAVWGQGQSERPPSL